MKAGPAVSFIHHDIVIHPSSDGSGLVIISAYRPA
jgi:hypothetical protein